MKRDISPVAAPPRAFAANESQSSEQRTDLVVDHAPLAAALLDAVPGGAVLYSINGPLKANAALAHILGFADAAEFLNQGPRALVDLYAADEQAQWSPLLSDLLSGRRLEARGRARLTSRNKAPVPVECQLIAVPFGNESCILAIISKFGEEAQAAPNGAIAPDADFLKLLEAMPYGISLTHLDGRLRYANPAYHRILGYETGELTNVASWDFIVEDQRVTQIEFFASLLRELPTPLPNITQCRKKNGEVIDLLINWIYDRDENGKVKGFMAVITDVTTRLKVETELRDAKDAAERANREKSKFLAAASHDLQQPLHSLSILLGLLQRPMSLDRQREIVETMGLALDGAMAVLRTVLDMSKLEAGVILPRFEDFDLDSSFDQIKAELGPQISQKPVECRLVGTSAVVHSDRMLLKSILHNLVSNAIRYTSSGKILVGCRRKGGRVRIEIHDTGRGIPLEKQTEIFEEFKRLESPGDERQVYALGLGLSIVERTCKLLGYKIKLRSKVGQGSCFSFEVPLAAWATKAPRTEKEPAEDSSQDVLAGRKILVLENDFSTLAHTNMLLESWGCDCMAAETVAQARQAASQQMPELILADYHLNGDITGVMAVEEIRSICQADIPAIIVTSDQKPEVLGETREHGFSLLEKPVRPGRLRALMTHFLQSGQA